MFHKPLDTARWKGLAARAWPALLFVGLYIAGAELGRLLSFSEHFPTIWPPSGILLAALLLSDARRWPAIMLLALPANLVSDLGWNGQGLWLSCGHWLITAGEALTGAWLLRRFVACPFTGETLREVLGLSLLAALVTTMCGAVFGEMLLKHSVTGTTERLTWELWVNSHMLGVIVFAPCVLALAAARPFWPVSRFASWSMFEALAAFSCLTVFAHLVYSPQTQPYAFLVFPILIWIALRFEAWGTCVGNLIRVAISIWSTRLGHGPFAGDYPATEQAVILNSFLSITCATALFLAAVISERRRAMRALQESELRYRDLLENIGDLVHSVNAEGTILYTNGAWRETLGYEFGEIEALSMFQVVHPEDLPRYRVELVRVLTGQSSDRHELRFVTKDGRTLVVEGTSNCRIVPGQPTVTRSIYRDITNRRQHEVQLDQYRRQLEAANSQLQRLATTDGLTGLHNRRAFHTRLKEEMERAGRHSHDVSLLMVDVDHFKQVNDLFGHPIGDKVLQRVAHVLEVNARDYDFVARVGGEEFAVILPNTSEEAALAIAERLRMRIAAIPFPGRVITASVGVASLSPHLVPADTADEGQSLIKAADAALYHSKRHGRNQVSQASIAVPMSDTVRFDDTDSGTSRFEMAKR